MAPHLVPFDKVKLRRRKGFVFIEVNGAPVGVVTLEHWSRALFTAESDYNGDKPEPPPPGDGEPTMASVSARMRALFDMDDAA